MPRGKSSQSYSSTKSRSIRKKKPISSEQLKDIQPLTENQEKVFSLWKQNQNMVLHGCAGTGKTFLALYLALKEVMDEYSKTDKIYIFRSLVPTREIGFLPGDHDDKASLYQIPYKNMVKGMFDMPDDPSFEMLYGNLKNQETISFWSTSFIRGTTLDNCIIIVDEFENLNGHELDSLITRVGINSKIIFCGDAGQSDLIKTNERKGIHDFTKILREMSSFSFVEFQISDIVRSGLVKEYLTTKYNLGIEI
jgi:predicted ribonuclease YlaK